MKLYVVRNKEGKYFRNIGYGGNGVNWQETLEKAKFYAKIGQAKSRVTYYYKAYPKFGCPEILEFDLDVAQAKVLNMEELTTKKIAKAKKIELERQVAYKEYQRKSLLEEKAHLERKLKDLQ